MLLENKYSPAMLRVYSKVSEFLEENCIEEKKKNYYVGSIFLPYLWDEMVGMGLG